MLCTLHVASDSSALYGIQALWTVAHLKLPVTFIIISNRSYRIIKERLQGLCGTDRFVAMDMNDPPIDFVSVAHGSGMPATRVAQACTISGALEQVLADDGSQLLEVIVSNGYDVQGSRCVRSGRLCGPPLSAPLRMVG